MHDESRPVEFSREDADRLLPTSLAEVPCSGNLYVPKSVGIEPYVIESAEGSITEPCLVYPMATRFKEGLPTREGNLALMRDEWSVAKPDMDLLLNAFWDLAEADEAAVRSFVLNWGPMWLCARHWHERYCLWSPNYWEFWRIAEHDCLWRPVEPMSAFRTEAARIRAVVSIASKLWAGERASLDDWQSLGVELTHPYSAEYLAHCDDEGLQHYMVSSSVNRRLAASGGPVLAIGWVPDTDGWGKSGRERPKLSVDPGFGFCRLAWMQTAQLIAKVKALYTCDGCHQLYPRTAKRPPAGRKNYCPKCREQHVAQKCWNIERRGKQA